MSYEQFCLVMKRERKTTMRDLMSSFRKIDLNGDGYITAEELHKVLTKVGMVPMATTRYLQTLSRPFRSQLVCTKHQM